MQKESLYIPLFVHHSNPVTVYIIDNHIIGFGEFYLNDFLPDRSYMCLYKLFTEELTREAFPHQLVKFFLKKPSFHFNHPCLAGNIGDCWNNCLRLYLIINEYTSPPIQLVDFAITQTTDCGLISKKINHVVHLSAKESFYLFANICATASYNRLIDVFSESEIKDGFDFKLFTQLLDSEYSNDNSSIESHYKLALYPIYQFSLSYLEFIKDNLAQQKISPASVLAHSGAGILAILAYVGVVLDYIKIIFSDLKNNYNNLSQTEKIIYYAFLTLIQTYSSNQYSKIQQEFPEVENLFSTIYVENRTYKEY